ncbi:MAG: hypothetical protein GPJ51_13295 [Candidatus Heimdallarchaeota archaeon]|nr:hypothetical protein [Candidatus Heimdallarchaeota archaeon]
MGTAVVLAILTLVFSFQLYSFVPRRLQYKVDWIKSGTLNIPEDHKQFILQYIGRYLT